MDRGPSQVAVDGVSKSRTQLGDEHFQNSYGQTCQKLRNQKRDAIFNLIGAYYFRDIQVYPIYF